MQNSAPPASRPRVSGSSLRQFLTLARANSRVLRARVAEAFTDSRLMSFTIVAFIFCYMIVGYLLFAVGLRYVADLPGLGPVLSERIFYLLFFFFFLMLAFSNGVISYTTLYRSRETRWLMSLPVTARALFSWKFVETLVFSSWGLIVISAPLLAAYGGIREAPAVFYIKAVAVAVPFVAIPAALASWLLVLVVRYVNRWAIGALALIGLYLLGVMVVGFFTLPDEGPDTGGNIVATVNQVLRHTQLSVHPLMPSAWMSNSLAGWSSPSHGRATFYALLVLSWALLGVFSVTGLAWRVFYPGYDASLRRRANSAWRRKDRRAGGPLDADSTADRLFALRPLGWFGVRRGTRALVRKDFLTFWRDPAQWVQFVIVFGLLFLYVLNLRNMGYDYESPFWSEVITLLNLGVCSLALSTLTTRFIFPQFSLEGRRLWILCMSPISLPKVVLQKFLTSWAATGSLTVMLMTISGIMLKLPPLSIAFFAGIIAMMSIALNALAVSLGTLFPNMRESNPAKIVSGFGGTLCLILSFLYIVCVVLTLAYPAAVRVAKSGPLLQHNATTANAIAVGVVAVLTLLASAFPLFLSTRRAKRVEILGNL